MNPMQALNCRKLFVTNGGKARYKHTFVKPVVGNYAVKDFPQEQLELALGLVKTNPLDMRLSW